ncbi:NAD(P)/FAD-dependent oxidoreductase [Crocosphaera sp. XPORK-15E]|uniref:phytoene desaturase family protein n=1 Tax=Crocosphaera sp. XPORK-15E TaxID=3110247 RepID=UPI002B1ECF6C|nr:NAD(P)/FAD-dependent oxidoreductase [Crocosphaera sp. XPORK-15E]MEA5535153.1 NAD(P)/FAD-dependent oxidoreductase [Crocosphaera sp. XPORK-15E]
MSFDIIIIGSGIGGLTAGALLARYGKKVAIFESHSIAGGAAHSFVRQGFKFDSGPSFYCGLGKDSSSLNPLKQVLDIIGESLEVVSYDPLGHYHFPEGEFPVFSDLDKYRQAVAKITPQGAKELEHFESIMLGLYDCLKDIPTITLRSDLKLIPVLISHYFPALVKTLFQVGIIQGSVGDVMDKTVKDPWVRRLIDLECFLLSGLKAQGTVAPEVAFMLGERTRAGVEYPLGGSEAIVNALIKGFKQWGGELYLSHHVDKIIVKSGKVTGIKLRKGDVIEAPTVISNATVWDTYNHLLAPEDLPKNYREKELKTPTVESFMHLHLGIKASGLENLTGHHVIVHDSNQDISVPGNTCMISIPSVWDKNLAPDGHYVIHAYTLEPYQGWEKNDDYEVKKKQRSQSLYKAIEKVIPDIRQRVVLELIGTPLTHARFLRRHQGTYGPAIAAGKGLFPSCHTPIEGLYRVGDSTLPGIGVPAVAASGILCANTLVSPKTVDKFINQMIKKPPLM